MGIPPRTLRHWRTQLADRRVTSRELTEMALDAAQRGSEASKSFLAVHAAAARAAADAIDVKRAAALPLPPLAGIPLSIKDLFDEAGQVTGGGGAALEPRSMGLTGRRFALPRTLVFDVIHCEVATAFERATTRLSAAGAELVEIDVPEFDRLAAINSQGGLIAAEAWAWHRRLLEQRGDEYDPRVAIRIRRGASITSADYATLQAERVRWIASVTNRLAGFDVMLMPTVPIVAPTIAAVDATEEAYGSINLLLLRNPTLINFLDGCALSLPCHEPGAAPVGLMIAGTRGRDATVLALGAAIEEAIGGDAASRYEESGVRSIGSRR